MIEMLEHKQLKTQIVKPWSQGWFIAAGAYPGFCGMKRLEVFLLPLDRILVHRKKFNFVSEVGMTDRCSTMFALGIVFHNAASSLGDFSSCNSVDMTKNLSRITLAA